MKKLLILVTAVVSFATIRDSAAACNAWGLWQVVKGANSNCTCGSATGHASYRGADPSEPGDASGRIYVGNNGTNDIRVMVRCYADDGHHSTISYSAWNTGSYVFVACPTSYPYATEVACEIRP
jgi:hypothetical protein